MDLNKLKDANWREIVVAVLSAVILWFGDQLGLTEVAKEVVALIGGSYVGSSAIANINIKKRLESTTRQLKSRKFLLSLASLVLTVLGAKLNIDLGWAIGILGGLGNIGIGIADAVGVKDPDVKKFAESADRLQDGDIAPQFYSEEGDEYGD